MMNRGIFVHCALAALMLSIASASSQAVVIATDDFDSYGVGSQLHGLNGGTGFNSAWTINNAALRPDLTIINGGLNYAAGDISINSGSNAVQYLASEGGNTNDFASRSLDAAPNVVYFSVLYNRTNKVGNDDFFEIGLTDSITNQPLASGLESQVTGTFQVRSGNSGTAGGTVNSGVPSGLNQTSLLVVRAEKAAGSSTYNDVRLFVNPTSSDEGSNAFTQSTANGGLTNATNFNFRRALHEVGDATVIDNVVIATTFEQAVGAPVSKIALAAHADAFVQANAATTNFGSDAELLAKNQGASFSRKSYIRFDVSGVDFETGTAELRLMQPDPIRDFGGNANNLDYSFRVFGLNDGDAGENWLEAGINWNNAPANDGSNGDSVLGNATLLDTFSLTGRGVDGGEILLDSDAIADFINADSDGLVTFILTRIDPQTSDSVVHIFNSRETGAGSTLTLIAAPTIPEPATASLLAFGIAGLIRRRRRVA